MHIIVVAALSLNAGAVVGGLSPDQFRRREHLLVPIDKREGWYELSGPTQFKRGETLQIEGEVPKHMAEVIEAPKRKRRVKTAAPGDGTGGATAGDGAGGDEQDDDDAGGGEAGAGDGSAPA